MIKRLLVGGLKSLVDAEVRFAPVTVLLGPNAVGKSNLLEALTLLSRLIATQTLAEAFDEPLRGNPVEVFSLPPDGLPGLLQQDRAELSLEADVVPAAPPPSWRGGGLRYRISVAIHPKTGELEVADEYLSRLKKNMEPATQMPPRIEKLDSCLFVRRLGEAGQPRKEPIGLNHALVSNRQFSGESRYPDFDLLRDEVAAWRMYFLDPRLSMRRPQPPRETQDIGTHGEWLAPFLYRVKEGKQNQRFFAAIRRALHSAIPPITTLDVDLDPKRGFLDVQVVQDGVTYSSRIMSEGTLRVLALCALAGNPWPPSLIAFEEPENGVHPRRIEVVANLLTSMATARNTQVVVTTHSPTFISAMVEQSRKRPELVTLLRCRQEGRRTLVTRFDPAGPLFQDAEVHDALRGVEDEEIVRAALIRGWLDG